MEEEEKMFKTHNRSTAFFTFALRKHHIDDQKCEVLQKRQYAKFAEEFSLICNDLIMFNRDSEDHHDHIGDYLLDLDDFFLCSPDCRVKVLLELALHHMKYQHVSEAAVAHLTSAAIIAEYLTFRRNY